MMILFYLFLLCPVQAEVWPSLSSPQKTQDTSNDVALIISIEDYFFVSDIEGALLNGRDWYEYLLKSQGIKPQNIVLLENEKATKESIEGEANRLSLELMKRSTSEEKGKIWLIFIGHGAPSMNGSDGLLLGSDVQQTAQSISVRSISQKHLIQILEGEEHQKNDVIAFVDACFSGRDNSGDALVPNLQPLIALRDLDTGSSTILSAAKHDEFAGPLEGLDRPAFSYLALGALQGWGDENEDGFVTPQEITDFSKNTILAIHHDRKQTPTLMGENKDLVLSKAVLPAPDIGEIRLKLLPNTLIRRYTLQKSASVGLALGGITYTSLGILKWLNANDNEDLASFQADISVGDTFVTIGLSTLLLGTGGLYYYLPKKTEVIDK